MNHPELTEYINNRYLHNAFITPSVKKNETSLIFCMDKSPTKDFCEDAKRPENLSGRCNV